MDRSGLMSSFGENLDEMAFMTVISLLGGVTKDQLSLILLLTTFDISRRKSLIKDRAAYFRKNQAAYGGVSHVAFLLEALLPIQGHQPLLFMGFLQPCHSVVPLCSVLSIVL
jgi:hypothetical protein